MRILITGSAGFIGYHLTKSLILDGYEVLGVDNLNDYYDLNLKYSRMQDLGISIPNNSEINISNKFKNLKFCKVDISNKDLFDKVFNKFSPQKVINLAAQAGVRYSIENPYAF